MKFNLSILLVLAFLLATINAAPTGTHNGDVTFFSPGLGSCGRVNKSSDKICAVSKILYDRFTKNGNPNNNSLCGKKIAVTVGSKTVTVTMVDRCEACGPNDIDLSPGAFNKLAKPSQGRVRGHWKFV
ncbi:1226_t:CDS:1 [Paraglomus brasilianum]|uniref:1226_t:CDS:1 n=1 Tax=Paraglomus brasilianum TaxID=144538 RepID=A0A9N9C5F6_9GLOM|nr:1226_t:CDS:1 [Paraglomus brasilianum]